MSGAEGGGERTGDAVRLNRPVITLKGKRHATGVGGGMAPKLGESAQVVASVAAAPRPVPGPGQGVGSDLASKPVVNAQVSPTPRAGRGPGAFQWVCKPALVKRIKSQGQPVGGFINRVVVSAVRNLERRAQTGRENLHIQSVPVGTGALVDGTAYVHGAVVQDLVSALRRIRNGSLPSDDRARIASEAIDEVPAFKLHPLRSAGGHDADR